MFHHIKYQGIQLFSLRRMLLFALAILTIQISYADEKEDARTLKRKATKLEQEGDIYAALDYYQRYIHKKPKDHKTMQKLADLYRITRDYENAYFYYDSLFSLESDKYIMSYYHQGQMAMSLEKYKEAEEIFDHFRRISRSKKYLSDYRRLALTHMRACEDILEGNMEEDAVTISHLPRSINQPHIEFSPIPVSNDSLVYGSYRAERDSASDVYKVVRQLYLATQKNNTWTSEGLLSGPFNHPEYHNGNAVFTPDGKEIYFTRCRKNWQNQQICEIFYSQWIQNQWSEPEKLAYPINDANYTTTQPALGKNMRTGEAVLYFVSDRPEGKGGLDIWYTEYDDREGKFEEPRNAGTRINSRGDEITPYYDLTNRTLYFSSNGNQGLGGYDVYKATGTESRWSEIEHLPKPINTPYDDTYFSIMPNNQEGFFTSNRPSAINMENGSCCDDIFHYRFNECKNILSEGTVISRPNLDLYERLRNQYNVDINIDADDSLKAGVTVQLFLINDDPKEEILLQTVQTDENGKYQFQLQPNNDYIVLVTNYGYFDKKLTISTDDKDCDEVLEIQRSSVDYIPRLTIPFNIYYEHDKHNLTPEARRLINSKIIDVFDLFPNAIIEIGSHTDHTGTDEYNMELSQKRSESVVSYLIQRGISPNRLVAKGYGESQPVAPNENPDGSDNPEGRRLNRRTEIKIVGQTSNFYNIE